MPSHDPTRKLSPSPATRPSYRTMGLSQMRQKGQVTIPANVRRAIGLKPGDQVMIRLQEDGSLKLERIMSFRELLDSLPLATVPPIDWKALREEMAEEMAAKVFGAIDAANERRGRNAVH